MKLRLIAKSISNVKLATPSCVFTAFNNLAEATGAVNLVNYHLMQGAGTPSCSPPDFITDAFQRYSKSNKGSSEPRWK